MLFRTLAGALLAAVAAGADFGFSVILRAGLSGTGEWELGIGSDLSAPAATANVVPYWNNTGARDFQIGYTASSNTAFVRVGNDIASYHPANGGALATGGTWTLPAASFYVSAASRLAATSVSVSGMQLTTGMAVLQGLSATTLTASQPGFFLTSGFQSMATPVVMSAGGTSDWVLTGQITFNGLSPVTFGGANRSQLQFHLSADASDVPEPGTFVMLGAGLILIGCYRAGKGVKR